MTIRDEWIATGFDALRTEGIDAVRVDRIATRLGKTKGSFHHHFTGVVAYQQALLDTFEERALHELHTVSEAAAGESVPAALARVALSMNFDPALESAMRGWAGTAVTAREMLAKVDTARLNALVAIWAREVSDQEMARIAALVPHLILVGASVAQPTPAADDISGVFALLAALVPHVPTAVQTAVS